MLGNVFKIVEKCVFFFFSHNLIPFVISIYPLNIAVSDLFKAKLSNVAVLK